jgi:toxin YoeB
MGKYIVQLSKVAKKDLEAIYKSGDKKSIQKVKTIFLELTETPYFGTGNPEQLKHELSGFWSRRINKKDRLVYAVDEFTITVSVVSALGHYSDK